MYEPAHRILRRPANTRICDVETALGRKRQSFGLARSNDAAFPIAMSR
jgi:hypothetical protein